MSTRDGFAFDGNGTVLRCDRYVSKAGNDIVTVIVHVEDDKYPQDIPVKAFGKMAKEALELKAGDRVHIDGRLGGREWNGKYYADVIAETIAKEGSAEPKKPAPAEDDDVPF